MNRREFLALSALSGATLLQADTPKRKLIMGFSLYGMRSMKWPEALEACAKIGYSAVELALMPDWPTDPKKLTAGDRQQLRKSLNEHQLQVRALMENLPLDAADHASQLDRLKRAFELSQELVPGFPPVVETILGGKAGDWPKVREAFRKRLQDWVKLAEASKTTIAIKPHRMNALNHPTEVLKLLEEFNSPNLKLAYDWSHFEQREWTLAQTLKMLVKHTVFVHVKDTVITNNQARFVLPGEGLTNYKDYLKLLLEMGFVGCVCVEVSGMLSNQKGYDPIAAAKKSYETLKQAWPE